MMDIDISILGKDKKDFIQYMYDRQKEFEIYNVYRYKEIYSDIFKEMLAQDNIYKTKYFQTKYNNQAKENLQEYIV
jgi:predicted metal-dependent HD superfamily phosphohydrolase